MKCVFVSLAPLSPFTPWGRSWPWQAVCCLAVGHSLAALCTKSVLHVLEWTLKHRNYAAELLFLILRYAPSNRVNKAILVFFLLLSLFEKCISTAYSLCKCIRASQLGSCIFSQLKYRVVVVFGTWKGIAGTWELWVKHELKLAEP